MSLIRLFGLCHNTVEVAIKCSYKKTKKNYQILLEFYHLARYYIFIVWKPKCKVFFLLSTLLINGGKYIFLKILANRLEPFSVYCVISWLVVISLILAE